MQLAGWGLEVKALPALPVTPQLLLPGATPVIAACRRFERGAVSALTFQQNQRRPKGRLAPNWQQTLLVNEARLFELQLKSCPD